MRGKMRREAKKAAQGKHGPIVVQYTDKGKHEDVRVAPATVVTPQVGIPTNTALASLHDPEGLAHARAAYEFLDSARLLHCRNCDEEWIVFDAAWPQAGVQWAGPLAGKCETIDGYGCTRSFRAVACGPTTATLRPLGSGSTASLRSSTSDSRLARRLSALLSSVPMSSRPGHP